ncbi:Acyl-coenzyme A thioesterase 9, mitochondrial [Modicella reniformis]|uniref:Acyl-coenzyme A thioesterase 9, mitochondrial n=1 Tax=Modicella reniformis TaxID=1440133 RepID=A0A9P6MLG8_9FUNG|nr:Acyl-coenzyme A thioesterase 9, mitochondrial [Modicella reniformis]
MYSSCAKVSFAFTAHKFVKHSASRSFSLLGRSCGSIHQQIAPEAQVASNTTSPFSSESIEKTRNEILDKFKSNSAGRIAITSESLASNMALPNGKIFTVRPVVSWIDKLASQLGSLGSHSLHAPSEAESEKKYQKRELVLKTMQDSYAEVILPFKTDKALLEEYINVAGSLKYGKIMEDLDALAGAIAYKHADDGKPDSMPLTVVTASVDRIDWLKSMDVCDLRLSGQVTYVGYSSMESKAAQVNPMLLKNDTEKKLFQTGEDHKTKKRVATDSSLTKRPPTQEERFLIHDLYLEYSAYIDPQSKTKKPDDVEWMSDTKMSAIQIMQPQDRNIHDKIFGGYLMRLAYELAFCNASVFISSRPTFLALDEISFRKPVPIGTFLALDSQIVYAEGGSRRSFQVMVKADVLDINKKSRETTNTFWFTFRDPCKSTPRIMPRTYAESMLYLEGKRRRLQGSQLAGMSRSLSLPTNTKRAAV